MADPHATRQRVLDSFRDMKIFAPSLTGFVPAEAMESE